MSSVKLENSTKVVFDKKRGSLVTSILQGNNNNLIGETEMNAIVLSSMTNSIESSSIAVDDSGTSSVYESNHFMNA